MKAVIWNKQGMELADKPVPVVAQNQLLVKVSACGVSRDELPGFALLTGGYTLGTEAVGVVESAAQPKMQSLVGKRVVILPAQPCEHCHFCRTNRKALCDNLALMGTGDGMEGHIYMDGGGAEYLAVRSDLALPAGDALSDAELSCVSVFSKALAAAHKAEMLYGEEAAVLGNGALGLALVSVLQSLGCLRVYYGDGNGRRMQVALAMGAEALPTDAKANAHIRTVFDTLCTVESQRAAIEMTVEKGCVINCARTSGVVPYVLRDFSAERSLCSVSGAEPKDYYDVLKMLEAGRLAAAPIPVEAFALQDCAQAGKRLEDGATRILLKP